MSEKIAIFGYGSLILPSSTIYRFKPELKEKMDKPEPGNGRSKYILNFLKEESYKIENTDLRFLPAKTHGYKRYYGLERKGGNQLVVKSSDETDLINGVVITGLTQEQFDKIAETERGYIVEELADEELDYYIDIEDRPEKVYIFVAGEDDHCNLETKNTRNKHYEKFIYEGIEVVADHLTSGDEKQELIEKFLEDYRRSTFERHDGEWITVEEADEK